MAPATQLDALDKAVGVSVADQPLAFLEELYGVLLAGIAALVPKTNASREFAALVSAAHPCLRAC
ncbi:hypothetical protein X738_31345 [Mesorhizobium sp. LNHC209A00]|nr:hypothetical protein X738_31345 [Mesorhizobium sp. LNHC209A00]